MTSGPKNVAQEASGSAVRAGRAKPPAKDRHRRLPAPQNPVARVLPMLGLAHLDRPFDYLVDEAMDGDAQPGVRVRVRFSGRLVDGFLLERLPESDHGG